MATTIDDDLPSTRRFGRGAPPPEAIAEELRALRAEIDEMKRSRDDDAAKDEKKEDKPPPLKDRLRKGIHEHPIRSAAIAIVIAGALIGGFAYWIHSRHFEDTDDAQIDADISSVSPRVQGTITAVYVQDNQIVHAGDLIAEIDPRDLDVALVQARAAVSQAEAQLAAEKPNVPITAVTNQTTIATSFEDVATVAAELAAAERDLDATKAQVAQADASEKYAAVEKDRALKLAAEGALPTTQSDQRLAAAAAAQSNLDALGHAVEASQKKVEQQRARLAAAQKRAEQAKENAPQQLEAREANVKLHTAGLEAARAKLQQAELDRSYARILAPVDGVIGRKNVNIGDRVQPGQQLVALTQTDHVWVTANFRETQLEKMHPGQRTTVHVDAIDRDFNGEVESMPGATGAKYSLLPPENATGNYVKIVQRLPVRIKLDPKQEGWERLRPGMSVEPKVSLK